MEKDPNSFSSYGVAYFNRPNCEHLINIFGDDKNPKDPKQWLDARVAYNSDAEKIKREYETQDGSVSFKMLFTTLQAQESNDPSHSVYDTLKDAYKWIAHVSTHRYGPSRIIQEVSHVQMDIASAPTGLKHMRSIGVQFGLNKGQSLILHEEGVGRDGLLLGLAKNNHVLPHGETQSQPTVGESYMDTRLNGPADNPKSSCLGCHASSGLNRFNSYYEDSDMNDVLMTQGEETLASEVHSVFGVLSNQTYHEQVAPNVHVDFNQQIRIGLEGYLDTK